MMVRAREGQKELKQEDIQEIKERRVSAIVSLKEIIIFMAAVTFTIGITKFVTTDDIAKLRPISSITVFDAMSFGLLLIGLVRFYHGNVRFLDDNYVIGKRKGGLDSDKRTNILWLDFLVGLIVALLFAILSFYIQDIAAFLLIYTIIIILDVVWLATTQFRISKVSEGEYHFIRTGGFQWLKNNFYHLSVMILIYIVTLNGIKNIFDVFGNIGDLLKMKGENVFYFTLELILFSNAFFDFWNNRNLYFPKV